MKITERLICTILPALLVLGACSSQQDRAAVEKRNQNSRHIETQQQRVDEIAAIREREPATNEIGETDQPSRDDSSELVMTNRKRVEQLQEIPAGAMASKVGQPRSAEAFAAGMADSALGYYAPPRVHARLEPVDRENYANIDSNPVHLVAEQPVSTFSIDVDTGSYANVRRFLNNGQMPPHDAVRVEELINYFAYNYQVPQRTDRPFSINTEIANTPWNEDTYLLQVGLKGFEVAAEARPAANLVFLIDVSGSMQSNDKLPLLKNAFRLLTRQLDERDSVAMVVYAGSSGVVLEPTPGNERRRIMRALDQLQAGGRTNGAAGIRDAYALAEEAFVENGINRVVLATDGDFNVGTVNFESLVDLVQNRRKTGISLTTLGFGTGNYNDHLMEQLADEGNGNYAYIDSLNEARKVLVEELSSTLNTIAKDVKIQIEFNPAVVAEYRLIGYENRILNREDFNNDRIDAGEIGAGHTVTALYEISLVGGEGNRVDQLRYASKTRRSDTARGRELAFVRLRYKEPDGDVSELLQQPVHRKDIVAMTESSNELRFAGAVAAFGQLLRGGDYLEQFAFADVRDLAAGSKGKDDYGYRREFISLVDLATSLAEPDRVAQR